MIFFFLHSGNWCIPSSFESRGGTAPLMPPPLFPCRVCYVMLFPYNLPTPLLIVCLLNPFKVLFVVELELRLRYTESFSILVLAPMFPLPRVSLVPAFQPSKLCGNVPFEFPKRVHYCCCGFLPLMVSIYHPHLNLLLFRSYPISFPHQNFAMFNSFKI